MSILNETLEKMKMFPFAFLSVIGIFIIPGCGTRPTLVKGGESYSGRESIITEETLQITSLGFPKAGIDNKLQRRNTARRAAQVNAEAMIVEKLIGANLEGTTVTEDGRLLGEVIKKDSAGRIKGGKIVRETYSEDDSCEIVYQVTVKVLKLKPETNTGVAK